MPRYHFNVIDGVAEFDKEGTELPDLHSARFQALRYAGEIIADAGKRGDLGEEWRVEVTDSDGMILFRMDFLVVESSVSGKKIAM